MRTPLVFRILLSAVLAAAVSAPLFAQGTLGSITGQVTDPTGAAVPSARIVVTNVATNVNTSIAATATGNYSVSVYSGVYRVAAEADGFKRYVRDNVIVGAASTNRLDIALELGAVTETVEVSGAALSVQTENAKVQTSVENKFIDELPLVVGGALRSPFDLVKIAAQVNTRGAADMSIGGGQARAWDATLDGLSVATNRSANQEEIAYSTPSLEAITDFAVDTGGFKAEYGQAGGGVITFSSKSGTNELHGTAYDFLRNDKLDARGFFPEERSVYKQNDFGVALGGPVRIPGVYDGRNRTFFYATYEGFRNRVGANDTILTVPTPEMYNGDFSNWVNQQNQRLLIYDPATTRANPSGSGFIRDVFANNRIPEGRFSPMSNSLLPFARGVTPNRAGPPGTIDYIRNNFISNSGTTHTPTDKGSLKLDHLITDNHRIAYFMNISSFRRVIGAGGPPGLPLPLYSGSVDDFDTEQYRITYDWVVSPTVLNHFSIGANKFLKNAFSPNYGKDENWSSRINCFGNVIDCDRNFPQITFSNSEFSTWGAVSQNGTEQPHWAMKDDLSFTTGKHTFKTGFAFQSQRANGFGEQCIAGCASFSFLGTSVPGQTAFGSGSSFASFLLGDANGGQTETERFVQQTYNYYGFYFQDDWRLTPKLTLNLGVRYEFTQPPFNARDEYSDFTPDRPNPRVNNFPGALRFAGFGPGRENERSLVPGWYGGIGPRLGIAYAMNDKTTVRTAIGRSFSKVSVVAGSGHFAGFIGTYIFSSQNQGITPAFNWDVGLPPYPLPVSVDPNATLDPAFANNQNVDHWQLSDAARAPENFYWTFNIQREVASNTVTELGYSATVGSHLQAGLVNMNQVPTALWRSYVQQLGATGARNLFNAAITSAVALENNVPIPYPNFTNPQIQQSRTVNQALRPWPQYLGINTGAQGGDKSGHSSYHSLMLKLDRRFSGGLAFQWSYVFSKLLTDSDTYNAGNNQSQDQYNRRLEKSIGNFDQTHAAKFSTVYELPFGRGRRFLNTGGVANAILGGWRLAGTQFYSSGSPIRLTRNNPLPIFNGYTAPTITSYEGWRGSEQEDGFDPGVDRFLDRSVFPTQPVDFGNSTRHNPKVRTFPLLSENISIAKTFSMGERFRLDLRWEMFDMFNRVVFGTGNLNLDSTAFGVVSNQVNNPRQMQVGLKLYW